MPIEGDSLNDAFKLLGKNLAQQWKGKDSFAILLSDFKHGEAFLEALQLWHLDDARCQRFHCIAFVNATFAFPQLIRTHSGKDSVGLHALIAELQQKWPLPISGFHRIYLKNSTVMLTLVLGEFESQLAEVSGPINDFLLNHECEDLHLQTLKQIWRLSQADSTIVSLSASQTSQDNLEKAGFVALRHATPNGAFLTASCLRSPKPHFQAPTTKEAIIIGAGIAGCAVANSLAQRGWKIRLFDSQAHIASQASGNHTGLCHPTFSLDDNFQARLSRAGFFVTQQKLSYLRSHKQNAVHFGMNGHFQIAQDKVAAQLMQTIVKEQQLPDLLVKWLDAEQVMSQLNIDCEFGGWWFPQGMWINPASACNGYIDEHHNNVSLSLNTRIERIEFIASEWHLYNSEDQLIANSETLILANAHDAARLLPGTDLALSSSLRSVTRLPANQLRTTTAGVSGPTYLTAEFDGWRCAGASLVRDGANEAEIEASNLNDLASLIGPQAVLNTSGAQTRQCLRPNSADRLPLVGAVPDTQPITHSVHQLFHVPTVKGLFAVLGFGSRGLSWHAMAAEVLACQLNNEPQGIERSLINAIDPSRFVLRKLRKLSSQKKT